MWTRTPMRSLALAGALSLTLVACGGDDGQQAATPESAATDDAGAATIPTDTPDAGDGDGDDGDDDGLRGCEQLEEAEDGVYPVGDAGELTMTRTDDRLTVEEVRPAGGWSHAEDDRDDDDEVEIAFTSDDGREIEFEAEVDDGELDVDVCED